MKFHDFAASVADLLVADLEKHDPSDNPEDWDEARLDAEIQLEVQRQGASVAAARAVGFAAVVGGKVPH